MNDGTVSEGDSIPQNAGIAFVDMQDRSVLNVGFFADFNPFLIAAQYTSIPDRTAGFQPDATEDDGTGSYPGGRVNQRATIDCVPVPVLIRARNYRRLRKCLCEQWPVSLDLIRSQPQFVTHSILQRSSPADLTGYDAAAAGASAGAAGTALNSTTAI